MNGEIVEKPHVSLVHGRYEAGVMLESRPDALVAKLVVQAPSPMGAEGPFEWATWLPLGPASGDSIPGCSSYCRSSGNGRALGRQGATPLVCGIITGAR